LRCWQSEPAVKPKAKYRLLRFARDNCPVRSDGIVVSIVVKSKEKNGLETGKKRKLQNKRAMDSRNNKKGAKYYWLKADFGVKWMK